MIFETRYRSDIHDIFFSQGIPKISTYIHMYCIVCMYVVESYTMCSTHVQLRWNMFLTNPRRENRMLSFSWFRIPLFCDLYHFTYFTASVESIVLKIDKYQSEVLNHFSIRCHRKNSDIFRNIGAFAHCAYKENSAVQPQSSFRQKTFHGLLSTSPSRCS